ncbi:flagellar protein FlaG [Sporosarcina trichiuri]|uniref:flagellar protein FlaG n=1 Tax=Sporosarcina trichiuri TaxID=3056445 RepID=UPI0025B3B6C7|nr:flagellar protein FlaG [Sporosarcina sp. 0.2-SM1T-5]WJY26091.1 flagellar protein FlaG [Sporosarcina sp. 0.2-SM1T-5]
MVSQLGGSLDGKPTAGTAEFSPAGKVARTEGMGSQTQEQPNEHRELTAKEAKDLTGNMNKFLESVDTQLRFKMHDELHEYYVTIVDSKTDEVIREIPSKKLMDMHAEMKKFLGLLIDRKI